MDTIVGTDWNGAAIAVKQSDLYWEDAVGIPLPPLSNQLLQTCHLLILSQQDFLEGETILKDIHDSLAKQTHKKGVCSTFSWKDTDWTEANLASQGFRWVTESTILAVADGAGYAIKFVYIREGGGTNMLKLCHYTYGNMKRTIQSAKGQCKVQQRGNKTMNGTMLVYGAHNVYGPAVKHAEPRLYNPMGKVDPTLNALVQSHTEDLEDWEKAHIPAYAKLRETIAEKYDPQTLHRITPKGNAFAMTTSEDFVVDPHNDSGLACELVQFANRSGPLPEGHKWQFAICGCLLELPTVAGETVMLCVKGEGVYHGTLPTSSTEDTYPHGNFGSALVTKKSMVESLKRQALRGETTLPTYCSSHLYFGTKKRTIGEVGDN